MSQEPSPRRKLQHGPSGPVGGALVKVGNAWQQMVSGFMASTELGTAVNGGITKALLYSVRAWSFNDIS